MLIETRNRATVSIAAADASLDKYGRHSKVRPCSAPITKHENAEAHLGAGETDQYVYQQQDRARRPATAKPRIVQMIEQEREDGTLEAKTKERKELEEYLSGAQ